MAERLTEAAVKAAALPADGKHQRIIFDNHPDSPPGFGLRIMPTGRKSFVLRFKQNGKDRLFSIGKYPVWSLTAARIEARERRRSLDQGIDPDQAKRERHEAEIAAQHWGKQGQTLRYPPLKMSLDSSLRRTSDRKMSMHGF